MKRDQNRRICSTFTDAKR